MKHYSKKSIRSLFGKIAALKVFVVGDAMLDHYWSGDIERISPEAPVPVLSIRSKESRLGGAANVALNCKALGAKVYLLSMIGKDPSGDILKKSLHQSGIHSDFCIQSKNRITTNKTRLIAKKQQTIRMDEEDTRALDVKDAHHFIDVCLRAIQIEKPDILIFEDYDKGLLSENIIEKIITHCKHVGVMTCVDPKFNNFFHYASVDLLKPNLKEVKEALKVELPVVNAKTLQSIHKSLQQRLNHHTTLITLSEHGVFVSNKDVHSLIASHIRQIADVSGAGDTVIAVASILYFLSKDAKLMAEIANLAGGLVCEESGVACIRKDKLLAESLQKIAQD
jgi:rfaE bifunctional protein kinase chain/domain